MTLRKIVIFGSTGSSGLATTEAAISKGYEVTAFVRDRLKLGSVAPSAVVEGDVLNKEDVDRAIKGQEGVIIVLGTRNDLSPTTVLSEGTKNILQSMQNHGVRRVSCCISSFLFWDRNKVPKPYIPVTEDHERMLEALKSSNLDWVAAFPPHIADEPARGDYVLKKDEAVGRVISKHDLANILVDNLGNSDFYGHVIGMGYP